MSSRLLAVDHNLRPDELAHALAGVAKSEGVGDAVSRLLKGSDDEKYPGESYLQQLQHLLAAKAKKLIALGIQNAGAFLRRKAAPPSHYGLDSEAVEQIRRIIAGTFRASMLGLQGDMGWIGPDMTVPEDLDPLHEAIQAMTAGRLHELLSLGSSVEKLTELAKELPPSATWSRMEALVRAECGSHLMTMAYGQAGDLAHTALHASRAMTSTSMADWLQGHRGAAPAMGWQKLASAMRDQAEGDEKNRDWMRVAATETRWAHNAGSLLDMAESGVEDIWYLTHPDACARCKELFLEPSGAPRIFAIAPIVQRLLSDGGRNMGVKEKEWQPGAVCHPWCLPEDVRVRFPSLSSAFRRRFDGDMVVIYTASGQRLPITANHPILTPHGWIPAGQLHKGQYVFTDARVQWSRGSDYDDEHMPPTIHEVTEAIRRASGVTTREMEIPSPHLDGDRGHGEIYVVGSHGLGGNASDSALFQERHQQTLDRGSVRLSPLERGRFSTQPVKRLFSSPQFPVASDGESSSILHRHLGEPDEVRLADVSDRNTSLAKSIDDRGATDPQRLGETEDGSAPEVFADEIIRVDLDEFHGDVYNLQTSTEYYSANNVIVHNCGCRPMRVVRDAEGEHKLPEGLQKSDAAPKGAMLALWVPERVAKEMAVPEGEPPERFHVTLIFLGKAADYSDKQREEIVNAVGFVTRRTPMFPVSLRSMQRFAPSEGSDGKEVWYRPVATKEVASLRRRLLASLARIGVNDQSDHTFSPHVTLKYGTKPEDSDAVQRAFTPSGVTICFGADRTLREFGR